MRNFVPGLSWAAARRVAVAGLAVLMVAGITFPALALCCCTEHSAPGGTAQTEVTEHAGCHGESAPPTGLQITGEEQACVCAGGHAAPELAPTFAVQPPGGGVHVVLPAFEMLPMPSERVSVRASNRVAHSPLLRHLIHCSFLI